MKNIRFASTSSILKSRGFVAALSACLIALGAAAWVGISSIEPEIVDGLTADNSSRTESVIFAAPDTISKAPLTSSTAPQSSRPSASSSAASSLSTQSTVTVVTPSATFFVMPLGNEVIKPFSQDELQYSMTFSDWRLHTGIDIAGKLGDDIAAAGDGTVIEVSESSTYGKCVKINHGNGIIATYCGLANIGVNKGDTVKVNDIIGTLGEIPCESVEPIHLHFSVTQENKPIDPMNIIGVNDAAHGSE